MAKMRVGAVKHARPAQLELDRLVSEVLNKRGPGAVSTKLKLLPIVCISVGNSVAQLQQELHGRGEWCCRRAAN